MPCNTWLSWQIFLDRFPKFAPAYLVGFGGEFPYDSLKRELLVFGTKNWPSLVILYVLHQTVWIVKQFVGFFSPNVWGWWISCKTYVSKIKWERHFPTRCELWWYFTSTKSGICDATKSAIASGESEGLHFCIFQGDLEGAKGWSLQQGAVGFEGTWDPWERFNLQNCLDFFHSDETPWEYLLHESEKGKWMIVINYCLQYIGWLHLFEYKGYILKVFCTGSQYSPIFTLCANSCDPKFWLFHHSWQCMVIFLTRPTPFQRITLGGHDDSGPYIWAKNHFSDSATDFLHCNPLKRCVFTDMGCSLAETNSWHLKMDGCKRRILESLEDTKTILSVLFHCSRQKNALQYPNTQRGRVYLPRWMDNFCEIYVSIPAPLSVCVPSIVMTDPMRSVKAASKIVGTSFWMDCWRASWWMASGHGTARFLIRFVELLKPDLRVSYGLEGWFAYRKCMHFFGSVGNLMSPVFQKRGNIHVLVWWAKNPNPFFRQTSVFGRL